MSLMFDPVLRWETQNLISIWCGMCLIADENEQYEVKVKGVDISPDPIARGEPATFSISANTGTHSLHI